LAASLVRRAFSLFFYYGEIFFVHSCEFFYFKGRGSFGVVNLCFQNTSGAVRARKQLILGALPDAMRRDLLRAFREEWNVISRLPSAHLVQYHDIDIVNLCIFMEYCSEGSLGNRARAQQFSEAEAAMFTAQLLVSLKVLHEKNLCHGDLKAEYGRLGFVF
jgi:serine/threonine protein kinase